MNTPDDAYVLPCDVRLSPCTTVRAGCTLGTLKVAMQSSFRQRHFEDRVMGIRPPCIADRLVGTKASAEEIEAKLAEALAVLRFIEPSLPVLRDMCKGARLKRGADKAAEMLEAVRNVLA